MLMRNINLKPFPDTGISSLGRKKNIFHAVDSSQLCVTEVLWSWTEVGLQFIDASYERDLIKSLFTVGHVCLSRTLRRPLSSRRISWEMECAGSNWSVFSEKRGINFCCIFSLLFCICPPKPNVCTISPQRQELDLSWVWTFQ